MSNISDKMQWPYPEKDIDPWYDTFESMVTAQDASGYASREDRQLIFTSNAGFSWDAGTGVLSWDAAIDIVSAITGFYMQVPAGSVTLADSEVFYVTLTRALSGSISVAAKVAGSSPNTDDDYAIAIRRGSAVYFRNGRRISDGMTGFDIFSISNIPGTSGEKIGAFHTTVSLMQSYNSAVPLVVGAVVVDPSLWVVTGSTMSATFDAVMACGASPLTVHAKLRNVTDAADVVTLDLVDTTATTHVSAALAIGAGAGELPNASKIYEVTIWVDAPGAPTDTIEMYSASISLINTIV